MSNAQNMLDMNDPDALVNIVHEQGRMIAELQQRMVEVNSLGEMTQNTGGLTVGNIVATTDETMTNPEDENFTGWFASGAGKTFANIAGHIFNAGAVATGNLQVGYNTLGQLIAAAGAWILDANGIAVTGVNFLYNHIATITTYIRRFRQGFQDNAGLPEYRFEYFDDSAQTNLITSNPGFETGDSTGWTAAGAGTVDFHAASAHSWSYGCQIIGAKTLTLNKYAITAGVKYKIGGWIKSLDYGNGAIIFQARWYTAASVLVKTDTILSGLANVQYMEYYSNLFAPATATQVDIYINVATSDDAFHLDDFYINVLPNYAFLKLADDGVTVGDENGEWNVGAHIANTSNPHAVTAAQVGANPSQHFGTGSLVNNTAYSFVPNNSSGIISIFSQPQVGVGQNTTEYLTAYYNVANAGQIYWTTKGTATTVLQNTVLTGTTGAVGDLTISCVQADGNIYIENRRGGTRPFRVQLETA